jgi:hypothetical protein
MMMFHCGSPVGEILIGWSFASKATSEQVAS